MQNIPWAGAALKKSSRYHTRKNKILSTVQKMNVVGALTIKMAAGNDILIEKGLKGPSATLSLADEAIFQQLVTGGSIAFAEAYLQSKWETPDLVSLLEWCSHNQGALDPLSKQGHWTRLLMRAQYLTRPNSRRGSRMNISAHYDLGNTFYSCWLDSTMSYSAGHFQNQNSTLEESQVLKFEYIINALGLKQEHHLLDIGGGWGGFACYTAARIGCQVTVTTISKKQYDYILRKVARKKLGGLVRVLYSDYRDLSGIFDRISSIEMLEAVGERYWAQFANALNGLLTPEGRVFIQTILIKNTLFAKYRKNVDFIQKYIFPGGMLPSDQVLSQIFPQTIWQRSSLPPSNVDYPSTLSQWRRNFESAWPKIQSLGFNSRFFRLWEFYLAYCEAGFRSGRLKLSQQLLERTGNGC